VQRIREIVAADSGWYYTIAGYRCLNEAAAGGVRSIAGDVAADQAREKGR
jgi:hypothetical protein